MGIRIIVICPRHSRLNGHLIQSRRTCELCKNMINWERCKWCLHARTSCAIIAMRQCEKGPITDMKRKATSTTDTKLLLIFSNLFLNLVLWPAWEFTISMGPVFLQCKSVYLCDPLTPRLRRSEWIFALRSGIMYAYHILAWIGFLPSA